MKKSIISILFATMLISLLSGAFVVSAEDITLIDEEFDGNKLCNWNLYVEDVVGGTMEATDGNIVFRKTAGSTSGSEAIVGWYNFNYIRSTNTEGYSALGKHMFRGEYAAETTVKSHVNNQSGNMVVSLVGHRQYEEPTYRSVGPKFYTYNAANVYIYQNQITVKVGSSAEEVILTENTYEQYYKIRFEADTENNKVKVYVQNIETGIENASQEYGIGNYASGQTYFLRGIRYAIKNYNYVDATLKVDNVKLIEKSNATSDQDTEIHKFIDNLKINELTDTPESVTGDLKSLWTGNLTTSNGIQIQVAWWESSKTDYMDDAGKLVKRPVGKDVKVEMRVIYFGRVGSGNDYIRHFKSFYITLKALDEFESEQVTFLSNAQEINKISDASGDITLDFKLKKNLEENAEVFVAMVLYDTGGIIKNIDAKGKLPRRRQFKRYNIKHRRIKRSGRKLH